MVNRFDNNIVLEYTTTSDNPETFSATGTVGGLRDFCDWLHDCLRDLADTASC